MCEPSLTCWIDVPTGRRLTPNHCPSPECPGYMSGTIDQLYVVGIYHFLKAHNFPEFLGYVI